MVSQEGRLMSGTYSRGILLQFTFMVALSAPALAECGGAGSVSYCDGCVNRFALQVDRNTPCSRAFVTGAGRARGIATISDYRVVRPARHGIGGVNGPSFAYAPSKDFVGTDNFAVELIYGSFNGAVSRVTVEVTVTVR
jgi:hypothetical protein